MEDSFVITLTNSRLLYVRKAQRVLLHYFIFVVTGFELSSFSAIHWKIIGTVDVKYK